MDGCLGDFLKSARQRRGWSQNRFADALGVRRNTVQRWERSQARPSDESLERACALLEIRDEQHGALSARSLSLPAGETPKSLEALTGQVWDVNARVWGEQDGLMDLRALSLQSRLREHLPDSPEIAGLLVQAETDYAYWLFFQNREEESRVYVRRALATAQTVPEGSPYRTHPLNLASALQASADSPAAAMALLHDWLPRVPDRGRFTLLCDMAVYAGQAGLWDEADALLSSARRTMRHAPPDAVDGPTYYRLTHSRVLLAAGRAAGAMSLMRLIQQGDSQELLDLLLWSQAYLADGNRCAASNLLMRAKMLLAHHPFPRLAAQVERLSRRL